MRRSIIHPILVVALVLSSLAQAGKQAQSTPGSPRVVSLSLAPSQVGAAPKGYSLLPFDDGSRHLPFDDGSRRGGGIDAAQKGSSRSPKTEELTQGDGASFYNQAAQGLPASPDSKQLGDWMKLPLGELPPAQVQAAVRQAKVNLDLIGQGAKCKGCNWPAFVPGTMPAHLTEYRQLALLLCLKARLEIAQGQYDKAIETIRTGLAMSKHMGEAPTIIQGMTGIAAATVMLRPMEDLAQTKGSPNLYSALQALPHPLVDMEVPIAAELKNLESSKQYNALTRGVMRSQLDKSHQGVRVTMHRLDAKIAALQCVEALRHYAASHNGQLPQHLSEIPDAQVPEDPVSGRPFAYQCVGSKAVLEESIPKDASPSGSTRYEITVAR